MVFSTFTFLFVFLPTFLVVYYAGPRGWRPAWIAVASYVFYGWAQAEYCLLLAGTTLLSYVCGKRIFDSGSPQRKRIWLCISVVGPLGLLAFFKYAGMLSIWTNNLASLVTGRSAMDAPLLPIIRVALPVGISFFTFQAISYTVDLYRGHARPAANLIHFAGYISMFPQLIAGPIVRYQWISEELEQRTHSAAKFSLGLHLFVIGLAKKTLLADVFSLAVPAAFGTHQPDFAGAWLGALGYTLQIYFDFSAYSDMAAGLGLLFGFTFPQNFNSPYKSNSITEFWRRWHISLSSFLRDYLYIPLGGNRYGSFRTYFNLMVVMLLGGLWHGASVLFLLWGLWHGSLLAIERGLADRHPTSVLPRPLATLLTNLLVVIGWVLFRAEDLPMASRVLQAMFLPFSLGESGHGSEYVHWLLPWLVPAGIGICLFVRNSWEVSWTRSRRQVAADVALCALSLVVVVANQGSPFLYFQF